jgi:HSP20 family molecular chaperone IbpA
METENSTKPTTGAQQSPHNPAAPGAESTTAAAAQTSSPPARAKRQSALNVRKSTMTLAGVAILAGGILVGITATKYVAGIPSANAATQRMQKQLANTQPGVVNSREWNPFQEIRDMQLNMDRMFDQMNTNFHLAPSLSAFADSPGYSLSLNLRDMKDHYEVRAYLPNAKASDVKVSLLDKQTLKVEVDNSSTQTAGAKGGPSSTVSEWGQYAQIIRLPSPVKSEQMSIDKPSHELRVTLPKANG